MALVEASFSCTPWPQVSCTRPKLKTCSSHARLSAWMRDASAKPVPPPALSISPAVMEEPELLEPKPEFKWLTCFEKESTKPTVSVEQLFKKADLMGRCF